MELLFFALSGGRRQSRGKRGDPTLIMRNKEEETVVADTGNLIKEMGDLTTQWIKDQGHKHERVAEMLANNISVDGKSN